jgi:hypothetical protein
MGLELLLTLAVLGFVVWVINLVDMPPKWHTLLNGLAILLAVLYVLHYFGIITSFRHIGRL